MMIPESPVGVYVYVYFLDQLIITSLQSLRWEIKILLALLIFSTASTPTA